MITPDAGQAHCWILDDELPLSPALSAKLTRIGWWRLGKSACEALYGNLLMTADVR
jgi:hypothetical protein